jgi:hypothetical protein
MWDEEPNFLCWTIKTWEHAARSSDSSGATLRVRDSQRLLPNEITAPIYAALAGLEETILRLTEPFPPFEARLLRETLDFVPSDGVELDVSRSLTFIYQEDTLFRKRLSEVVPDWDAKVAAALGAGANEVNEKISSFAADGIPRGEFPVSYGYRIDYRLIKGLNAGRNAETHRSLLMGCNESVCQPGFRRDVLDAARR